MVRRRFLKRPIDEAENRLANGIRTQDFLKLYPEMRACKILRAIEAGQQTSHLLTGPAHWDPPNDT